MIAILRPDTPLEQKAAVVRAIESSGFHALVHEDDDGGTRIGVVGEGAAAITAALERLPGVAELRAASPYPLVSSEGRATRTIVPLGRARIGGDALVIVAGPCAVESREQLLTTASYVRSLGCDALRGGAFKPRTSPYSFQGLGIEGLCLLAEARAATGLPVVTEIVDAADLDAVVEHADVLQVGARNMQNFRLLRAVGSQPKPVLLKRGLIATLDELLHAAEYVAAAGNPSIVLCERGVRTHERATRNTLDVAAIPVLKRETHLPVIVDPSHAGGHAHLVAPLAAAAIAAGADGLMIEVHNHPELALSDSAQALTPSLYLQLVAEVRAIHNLVSSNGN